MTKGQIMALYMQTTKIEASKTVAEIQSLLGSTGQVRAIQVEYGPDGAVEALSFVAEVEGCRVPFRLPARVEPVFRALSKQRAPRNRTAQKYVQQDKEQAVRVAWRQILRWVQAQIALLDTGMVDISEIFLPYVHTGIGRTIYTDFMKQVEGGKYLLPERT